MEHARCAAQLPPGSREGAGPSGGGRGVAKGAGAFCRGSEAPGEGRMLGAGRGRGRGQSVGGARGGVAGGSIGAGLCGGLPGHVWGRGGEAGGGAWKGRGLVWVGLCGGGAGRS